jgi:hypothetical protein
MNIIIKYKYLLLCILGNLIFFTLGYLEYGRIRFTFIHFFFGIIPLIFSIKKHFWPEVKS